MKELTYLLTGDWELDSSRLPEAKIIVDYLVGRIVEDEQIDGVIFTGDLFREYNSQTIEFARRAARAFQDALTGKRYDLRPKFLVGNHDRDIGVDRLSAIFSPEFDVIAEPRVSEVLGHYLAFLPAPDRAAFGASRSPEGNRTRDERLSEALDAAVQWLEQEAERLIVQSSATEGGTLLAPPARIATQVPLIFHATVNSTIFNGSQLSKGLTWTIDSNRIAGFGAAVGGHIHKPSMFSENGFYTGGIFPVDFGEKALSYRAVKMNLAETGDIMLSSITLPSVHDLVEVTIDEERLADITANGFRLSEWLVSWIAAAGIRDGVFSLKLRAQLPKHKLDLMAGEEELAEKIRADFPGLKKFVLKKEPTSERKARLTADETADRMSLPQLVDRWNELAGGSADDGALKLAHEIMKTYEEFEDWSSDSNYGFEPIRTEIKNFRQWEDVVIDWDGLQGAVSITGDNATGKTNFAEAPLFSLYKTTPSSPPTLDDELRHGAESGHVITRFDSGGKRYEIRRTLERAKNGDVSCKSEFFEIEDEYGLKRPVCEKAIEIDKAVARIVGPREFVEATFYGTQDQIDALIVATPAIWHKRIRESLGLERFEHFRELAGKRKREDDEASSRLSAKGDEVKASLVTQEARLADYDVDSLKEQQETAAAEKTQIESDISSAETEILEREAKIQELAKMESDIAVLVKEIDTHKSEHDRNTRRLVELDDRIAETKVPPVLLLDGETLADARSRLCDRIDELKESKDKEEDTIRTMEREVQRLRGRMEALSTNAESSQKRIKEIRELYEKRVAEQAALPDPPCVGLEGDLGLESLRHTSSDDTPAKEKCTAWIEYSGGETIEALERSHAGEEKRLAESNEAHEKMKGDVYKFEETRTKAQLLLEKHTDELAVVQKAEADVREAQAMELSLEGSRGERDRLTERQGDLVVLILAAEEAVEVGKENLEGYDEKKRELTELKNSLSADRLSLRALDKTISEFDTKLATHTALSKTLRETKERAETLAREITVHEQKAAGWSLLEKAFHSTGIPFLLMERTIPALEKTANELLSGTDLSLIFETVKTKKDGSAKDEINVRFRDPRGEFPLRVASGAQRAILSFAARFALAKVGSEFWSRRPKVFIQDEGWGRFNARRYDTARELIERVAKVFDRFVYITHVDELADVADVRLRTEIVDGKTQLVA